MMCCVGCRASMIFIGVFGVIVIAINIFLVVDTLPTLMTTIHWAIIIVIAIIAIAYFAFIIYLVSATTSLPTLCA